MQSKYRTRFIWWCLAVPPIVALLLAFVVLLTTAYRARNQAALVAQLRRADAEVWHTYQGWGNSVPREWRDSLGDDWFYDVDTVRAINTESSDTRQRRYSSEQIATICSVAGKLRSLRSFRVRSDEFDFRQIANWPQLDLLEDLSIDSAQLTDADLAEIGSMRSLRAVGVASPSVSDGGIKQLAQLANLVELSITCPQVADAGILTLPPLPELKILRLHEAPLTDRSLAHFSTSPLLEVVDLSGTEITDAGLRKLIQASPQITYLNLGRTRISDIGLVAIANTPLRNLTLEGTAITDAGIAQLHPHATFLSLDLSETSIKGESLGHLHSCEFETLDLSGTPLTTAGLAEVTKLSVKHLNLQRTTVNDETLLLFNEATKIREIDVRGTGITLEGARSYTIRRQKAWSAPGAAVAGLGGPSIRCDFAWEE